MAFAARGHATITPHVQHICRHMQAADAQPAQTCKSDGLIDTSRFRMWAMQSRAAYSSDSEDQLSHEICLGKVPTARLSAALRACSARWTAARWSRRAVSAWPPADSADLMPASCAAACRSATPQVGSKLGRQYGGGTACNHCACQRQQCCDVGMMIGAAACRFRVMTTAAGCAQPVAHEESERQTL